LQIAGLFPALLEDKPSDPLWMIVASWRYPALELEKLWSTFVFESAWL
jgi:hypothetical protein